MNNRISGIFHKRAIFVLLISTMLLLSGCLGRIMHPDTLARADRSDLFAVAASAFIPVSPDNEWDEIHVVETDSYGRVLFIYEKSSNNGNDFNNKGYWAFVCQKSDGQYAYYFDDCFIRISSVELSEDESQTLKSMNGWNQPFENSIPKYSKTKLTDVYARYDEVNEPLVLDLFECGEDKTEKVYSICKDKNNLSLYQYVQVESNDGQKQIVSEYMVLKLSDGKFIYEKVDMNEDYLGQISAFKQANGWDSGECTIIRNQK